MMVRLNRDSEIRYILPKDLLELVAILEQNNSWEVLMAVICREDASTIPRFTSENIRTIKAEAARQRRPASEILFVEWGTIGRRRPRMGTLLETLVRAELFRAADFVAKLLGEEAPSRPKEGSAAQVDLPPGTLQQMSQIENQPQEVTTWLVNAHHHQNRSSIHRGGHSPPPSAVVLLPSLVVTSAPEELIPLQHISYAELEVACGWGGGPADMPHTLGSGGFGTVYLARLPRLSSEPLAVKRLDQDTVYNSCDKGAKKAIEKQFLTEVHIVSKLPHENLLPVYGFSSDGPHCCLIYAYMSNGSLQEALACTTKVSMAIPLTWKQRLEISVGTAKGVLHLHQAHLIHRDVKTANILLDQDFKPKLGDFGLVRVFDADGESHVTTETVMGSSVYMSPEASQGDISFKMDCFSYGIVLLELLTGLPAFDDKREYYDLIQYIDEIPSETSPPLLDLKAGDWGDSSHSVASAIYAVAEDCVKKWAERPEMEEVLAKLQVLSTGL